ncbi:PadR family transcriptional regulator [Lysinibacillus sphaericus]|uniref:DinB family protein n=1 Tax=Lysinibacillus sphaericus TaxID=1421 RepID=UPI0018CEAC1E|nr:DinB family protein [Lysinibacillus sphaericus]MBG9453736.1 PadR family transcriptional regulator [Lysinibacillus sphaericus]MBG9476207.1 PadR family transcriptional regulator [Lysinibacillus sphaericus]MBG9591621.1 PadR family transcriptional regulator [Lysinibacillus sphaericus]
MSQLINDQLCETRNNLVEEIKLLSDIQFNTKPDANSWSIAQVCHHLILTDASFVRLIAWALKQEDSKQVERKNIQLVADRTKKIPAPEFVVPAEDFFTVQQIIELLEESRKKFTTFLDTIEDPSLLAEKSFKHPFLGDLPLDQWVELVSIHEQRHIEQIKEIKAFIKVEH